MDDCEVAPQVCCAMCDTWSFRKDCILPCSCGYWYHVECFNHHITRRPEAMDRLRCPECKQYYQREFIGPCYKRIYTFYYTMWKFYYPLYVLLCGILPCGLAIIKGNTNQIYVWMCVFSTVYCTITLACGLLCLRYRLHMSTPKGHLLLVLLCVLMFISFFVQNRTTEYLVISLVTISLRYIKQTIFLLSTQVPYTYIVSNALCQEMCLV